MGLKLTATTQKTEPELYCWQFTEAALQGSEVNKKAKDFFLKKGRRLPKDKYNLGKEHISTTALGKTDIYLKMEQCNGNQWGELFQLEIYIYIVVRLDEEKCFVYKASIASEFHQVWNFQEIFECLARVKSLKAIPRKAKSRSGGMCPLAAAEFHFRWNFKVNLENADWLTG